MLEDREPEYESFLRPFSRLADRVAGLVAFLCSSLPMIDLPFSGNVFSISNLLGYLN